MMILSRITEMTGKIKLFLKNVWLLLCFDPIDKTVFSFLCGVFSLIIYDLAKGGLSRLLIMSRGVRYIDKGNMIQVCTSYDTLLLVLVFMIIMTFCALFEIGGLLHSFSMAQIGRISRRLRRKISALHCMVSQKARIIKDQIGHRPS